MGTAQNRRSGDGWLFSLGPPRLPAPARLAVAPVVVLVTVIVQHVILPAPSIAPFVLLYFAVTLAAFLGGRLSGLLAVALNAAAADYFFLPPLHSFALGGDAPWALVLFLVSASSVAILTGSLRSAMDRAQERAAALRESEEKLSLGLGAASMGTWDCDLATGVLACSGRTRELLGLPPDARPTRELILSRVHPADRERIERATLEALTTKRPVDDQIRVVLPEGSERWIAYVGQGVYDAKGDAVRMVGVVRDVSERMHADQGRERLLAELQQVRHHLEREAAELEEARHRSEELGRSAQANLAQLEAVVNSMTEGVIVSDLQGRVRAMNAAALHLHAYTSLEDAQRGLSEYAEDFEVQTADGEPLPIEDWPLSRVLRSESLSGFEVRVLNRKTGSVGHWAFSGRPVRSAEGEAILAVLTVRDVTGERRAQEALRESEERFRSVVEHMSEGILLFDAKGGTLFQNPASLRLHGVEEPGGHFKRDDQPVTWRGWDTQGRPLSFEQWPIARVLQKERLQGQVLRAEHIETGRTFYASYNGGPILDAEGKLKYGFITIRDITEQVHAEAALREASEKLRQADQNKNEFLGMLSHELRNPLAPIRNSVYLLRRAGGLNASAGRALTVIDRQVGQLSGLVDDLLDLTRIARGKVRLHRDRQDLADLVRHSVEDHRGLLEEGGLELRLCLPSGPVPVDADATRVQQMVGNLLHNAAKFTPKGGVVAVSLAADDAGRAVIEVADDGIGMDADTLKRLFTPFAQADRSLDRTRGGLGLGLALVKGLAELHGGEAHAHSAGPGKGSRFLLRFPLAAADGTGRDAQRNPPSRLERHSGRRVLIVEDNRDAADTLKEALALAGHEVEVAYRGTEGLEKAETFKPDVVLCDIGLPEIDGYELARRLRSRTHAPALYLVALTGYAAPEDKRRAHEAGFDLHLAKPPDLMAIDRILHECCG